MTFKLFTKCKTCGKMKLYVSDGWLYSPALKMRIRPKVPMCRKCADLAKSIK